MQQGRRQCSRRVGVFGEKDELRQGSMTLGARIRREEFVFRLCGDVLGQSIADQSTGRSRLLVVIVYIGGGTRGLPPHIQYPRHEYAANICM
eukprot:scaffold2421_cov390-Prasinococcus_capsulatus_cf.AAC.14